MARELIIPADQVEPALLRAVVILKKLRHYKKKWDEHYGHNNRKALSDWEEKADHFLSTLNIQTINDEQEINNTRTPKNENNK